MTEPTSSELLQQIQPDNTKSIFEEIDDFWAKIPEDDAENLSDELIVAPRGINVLPS